jgi:putative acetyltransferase
VRFPKLARIRSLTPPLLEPDRPRPGPAAGETPRGPVIEADRSSDISTAPTIRPETAGDISGIRKVVEAAFEQPAEARLIEALRAGDGLTLSLVAVVADELVGHIAFSPVSIGGSLVNPPVLALAPVAVSPGFQRHGIGIQLIESGLAAARELGTPAVIVLGHPGYYPRFGFRPASKYGITCPYPAPDEAFLAIELQSGGLRQFRGQVEYRPEFSSL